MDVKKQKQSGGRSWQRLVDDLLRYEPGVQFLARSPIQASLSTASKTTNYIARLEPPEIPYEEQINDFKRRYYFIFTNTRYHLEITVTSANPVADHDFHLVHVESTQSDRQEYYRFESSSTDSTVEINIRPPELSDDNLQAYSEEAVHERYEQYKHLKPNAPEPTPAACFITLFKILHQPLTSDIQKEISDSNASLLLKVDPTILTERFFFTHNKSGHVYTPPNLSANTNVSNPVEHEAEHHEQIKAIRPESKSKEPTALELERRTIMSRMILEIAILVCKYQPSKKVVEASIHCYQASGVKDLKDALPAPDPSANILGQEIPSMAENIYGAYVALGACEYFSSDLLSRRYDIQVKNDPINTAYYLESMLNIAQFRDDANLQIKVSEKLSLGIPTHSQLKEAYEKFGINLAGDELVDDSILIERYRERVKEDPSHSSSLKSALETISSCRYSSKLNELLSLENMSLENAYAFLDATSESDDDSIKTLFEFKLNTLDESQHELVKRALFTIAKDRMSSVLLKCYESLTFGLVPDMSPEEAYQLLGCQESMDVESIITVFEIRLKDTPDQVLELRQALRTIASSKASPGIQAYLGDSQSSIKRSKEPVGLGNIGNTCYLNSLLQYYFTIVPLREAVSTFENSPGNQEDPELFKSQGLTKKVGGQIVTPMEIKRSQMCKSNHPHQLSYKNPRKLT